MPRNNRLGCRYRANRSPLQKGTFWVGECGCDTTVSRFYNSFLGQNNTGSLWVSMKDLCQSYSVKVVPNSTSQAWTNGSEESSGELCRKA